LVPYQSPARGPAKGGAQDSAPSIRPFGLSLHETRAVHHGPARGLQVKLAGDLPVQISWPSDRAAKRDSSVLILFWVNSGQRRVALLGPQVADTGID
jgi:hypothetical protein